MKLPKKLWILVSLMIILGAISLYPKLFGDCQMLVEIASNLDKLILTLTLAAVIIYAYLTYLLAKDTYTPSASYDLKARNSAPGDLYHFIFLIQNHSKVALECNCNLNATVDGKPVLMEGFYGGKESIIVQPFGIVRGHFDIEKDVLAKVNRKLDEMKRTVGTRPNKRQLHMNIEFWYKSISGNIKVCYPSQSYYFDFSDSSMALDF